MNQAMNIQTEIIYLSKTINSIRSTEFNFQNITMDLTLLLFWGGGFTPTKFDFEFHKFG